MFGFFKTKKSNDAVINGQSITVQANESVLQAALREGIAFPHSCRVGGCATCKCQLLEGRVKELTESSYVLSEAELDQGFILACQSVPLTNVQIKFQPQAAHATQKVKARVIAQERLTHDITQLRVQLETSLPYQAGQYAKISLASLPGVVRSYSFANAPQANAQTSFLVRHVPGGQFSSHVHTQDLLGQTVHIEGPLGDFHLHPSQGAALMVAGGSGLGPILAMLDDMEAKRQHRPVILMFGARQASDLYAMDHLQALAQHWPESFTLIPVLSAEPAASNWSGARGWVTDHMNEHALLCTQAYLCGPPAMVDAAVSVLKTSGMSPNQWFTDRFLTAQDVASQAA